MDKNGISFIMCCFNSEKIIEKPLKAILKQENNIPCEVIIVDNNCSDNTIEFIHKIYKDSSSSISMLIVKENKPGVAWARKKGYQKAKYEYISFIDDDNIINCTWAKSVYDIFNNYQSVGIVGSNNEAVFLDGEEPEWFETVKGSYACASQGDNLEDVTYTRKYIYGAGLSIRKEVLRNVYTLSLPLYLSGRKKNILLSGEDSELCMRAILLGWKMFSSDELKLKHIMPKARMSWSYYCKMSQGHDAAFIILQIYMKLIDNSTPLTRRKIFNVLLKDWWKYIKIYKFKNRNQPNHMSSHKYTNLIGRTFGFIHYFSSYNEIVKSITNNVPKKDKNISG